MRKKMITLSLALVAAATVTGCAGMSMPYVEANLRAGFRDVGVGPAYRQYPQYGWRPTMVVKETTVERRRVPNSPEQQQQQPPARTFELVPMDGE